MQMCFPPILINYTNVWLYRLWWICTHALYCCADRAYCLFGENSEIFTCSSKEDYIISPPLSPLSLSDFSFNLLDGFIPDLSRHMETVIYKLLKTMARMLLEKSHSNSGKQCISLCRVVSSWCHCVGYTNTNLLPVQAHTPDVLIQVNCLRTC